MYTMAMTPLHVERFWTRVQKLNGCWPWTGSLDHYGYGTITIEGKRHKAHRLAFLLIRGTLPDGKELHHTCENKRCCNPNHLVPLTRREHIAVTKYPRSTHCKNGHPFDADNTYIWRGMRCCRTCNLMYTRLRRKVDLDPIRYPQQCWKCGHKWIARLPAPKQCVNLKCKVRQKHHAQGPSMTKPVPPKQ
jgi:hypothetical protein